MTYDPKADYCTLSPDHVFGRKISYACYIHDRQYRNEVKVRKTRKEADETLRLDIKALLGNTWRASIVSWIYYIGARLLLKRMWVK